jgi:alanine racemase
MTLRTRLIATQQLQPGDTVGYGSTLHRQRADAHRHRRLRLRRRLPAPLRHRHAGAGGRCARTAPVGRVSMDMLAVDLTHAARRPASGSEVTLWGEGPGGALLAIDEVAQAAGTIGYELMCAVAPRVPMRAG